MTFKELYLANNAYTMATTLLVCMADGWMKIFRSWVDVPENLRNSKVRWFVDDMICIG